MFNFPFGTSAKLKQVKSAFKKLENQWAHAEVQERKLLAELDAVQAFKADPFVEVAEMEKALTDENLTFIPNVELDEEKDDLNKFGIVYNDLIVGAGAQGASASDLSPVGWMRIYNGHVKNTGDVLTFKAFYRMFKKYSSETELKLFVFQGGAVPFYEDYLNLTGKSSIAKKWATNLEAIVHIKKLRNEHRMDYKQQQHRKIMDAVNPQIAT